MEILTGYFVFLTVFWGCNIFILKNTPTDVELWGEEIEMSD